MKNLVTAADIKEFTAVSLNAEDHKLSIVIPDAQSRHLRPLLGAKLLTQLLDFVKDAPEPPTLATLGRAAAETATAAYDTALAAWRTAHATDPLLALLDQLKFCLAQWVLIEAWPNILLHIDAAGMNLKTGRSEGTTLADAATLKEAKAAHRDTAVWRGDELINWLEAHKSDYPAYQSSCPLATSREPADWFGGISV